MTGRRSTRSATVAAPLALLYEIEPARRAITKAMATVDVGGPVYLMLEGAVGALDGVATVLGHAGRFRTEPPARQPTRSGG